MLRSAHPFERVFREQRTAFRMADEQRRAGVLERGDAVQHETADRHARCRAARQEEAAGAETCRAEDTGCAPARAARRPRRTSCRRRDVEAARLDDAPCLLADLDQLARAAAIGVHRVDGVRAAIEHVVRAARHLLERQRLLEQADDVRREAAGGPEDLDGQRGACGHVEQDQQHADKNRHARHPCDEPQTHRGTEAGSYSIGLCDSVTLWFVQLEIALPSTSPAPGSPAGRRRSSEGWLPRGPARRRPGSPGTRRA